MLQNRAPVRGSCSPLLASRFAGVIAMALAHRPVPGVYDVPVVAVPSLRAPFVNVALSTNVAGRVVEFDFTAQVTTSCSHTPAALHRMR